MTMVIYFVALRLPEVVDVPEREPEPIFWVARPRGCYLGPHIRRDFDDEIWTSIAEIQ